jgi:alkanesulfonate monooxygenase SsuD/methylene tetrahydromethanopterin reductase-like flavin-dependent oxidoreductase (luciferase family)
VDDVIDGPGRGVMLSTFDSFGQGIPPVGDAAARAESLGLDSVWAGDHLFFHRPNIEALVALAVAAGSTSRIGLGTGVLLPALREPVVLAKQLTSLHAASGGRLLLGIGVGGEFPAEWEAVGIDPAERGARTDEVIDLVMGAFTGKAVDHTSAHYQVQTPPMVPAHSEPPPVWVGGRADAALRRAARVGRGWLTVWTSARRMEEAIAQFEGTGVRPALLVFTSFGDSATAVSEQSELFVNGHYGLPLSAMERYIVGGPPAAVAESLAPYRELGVRDFVIYPLDPDPSSRYEDACEVYDLLGMSG